MSLAELWSWYLSCRLRLLIRWGLNACAWWALDLGSCQLPYDQKAHLMLPILDRSGCWDPNSILSAKGSWWGQQGSILYTLGNGIVELCSVCTVLQETSGLGVEGGPLGTMGPSLWQGPSSGSQLTRSTNSSHCIKSEESGKRRKGQDWGTGICEMPTEGLV